MIPCTLGITWHASEDVFTFVSHVTKQEYEWTKKNLLRKIVTLFGIVSTIADKSQDVSLDTGMKDCHRAVIQGNQMVY